MVKIKQNKWLIFLLTLAVFLRVIKLDYLELFGDEIDAGYQSYSLLTTARDYKGHWLPVYAQSFSEWRAPGLMYAMTPFIALFGLNEWGVRLCPAFFGVLSIIGFYWLLSEVAVARNIREAVVLFLAISPWHIQYSRTAFELTLLATLIIFGITFLVKAIKNNSNLWIVFSGVLLSAALYTYNTANILVPVLSLITLISFKAKPKQFWLLLVTGIVLSSPIVWQILFGHAADRFGTLSIFNNKEVTAEVDTYRNSGGNKLVNKFFYNKVTVGAKKIIFNYTNAFSSNFLFKDGDVTFRHSLHQVGNLYWVQLPLIILGIFYIFKSSESKKYRGFLLLFLVVSPLASSLTIDGYNHASRLFMLVFPLSFLAAYGLVHSVFLFRLIALLLLFTEFLFYQNYYWNFYRTESWRWWHIGYKEAMQYVSANREKYKTVVMDNVYEPTLIRYLFWTKTDPRQVFRLDDKMTEKVGGFDGFCLGNSCFVNYANKFEAKNLQTGTLYMVSHEKTVGGDWDWGKTPLDGVKTMKTVRGYSGQPIFYLLEKIL